MITSTEMQAFETRIDALLARFKLDVIAELKKAGIKPPDTFLTELSVPVQVIDTDAVPPSELPNMDDLEPIVEKTPEPKDEALIERDSKEFLALLEFSMLKGWKKRVIVIYPIDFKKKVD